MPVSHPTQRPSPALVTQKAVQRLPRWALWLLCAAYVLPGLFGRDPWKNEDIASFGHMWSLALHQVDWLHPQVGGIAPTTGGILPYWLGGAFISLLGGWLEPALAARIPFAALLTATLALTWYAAYYLGRTKAAQPIPLAFGGEAQPADYARALADGALLALIASLGLLQLGHETTPELLQLTGSVLFLFSLAAAAFRPVQAACAAPLGLLLMAGSGSAASATLMGLIGCSACLLSRQPDMRRHLRWVVLATVLAIAFASLLSAANLPGWSWRVAQTLEAREYLKLLIWFTWPTLPLAMLTIWHWRHHLRKRHIAVPLSLAVLGLLTSLAMGANDRAMLIALPPLAVLAAFALPILLRGLGSAIDWFSVIFFTLLAGGIWWIYVAMHTGVPARTAANVARLVPDYRPDFSWVALIVSAIATVCWLALVRWRTARHVHALWKSLVLPAGGVALIWLLLLSLWLPLLDQARSYNALMQRAKPHIPHRGLVCAPGAPAGMLTALEYHGGYRVDGRPHAISRKACKTIVLRLTSRQRAPELDGWQLTGRYAQRNQNSEQLAVYRPAH